MFTKNSDKILDKLSRKLSKQTPYRSDFVMADFRVLDHDGKRAEVLIQYDPTKGAPTKEIVAQTLLHYYRASDERPRIVVDTNSIRYFPQYEAVACHVSVPVYRRPFEDTKRMTPIVAGTMFLGENMEDTWRVAKSAEGAVYIERLEEEDIDTILRERSRAKSFRAQASVTSLTLNRIAASTSEQNYSIGDVVACTYKGDSRTGEIIGISTGGAQVRFDNGEQATVAIESMYKLVQASKESLSAQKKALKDYFKKAYGYSDEEIERLVSFSFE